MARTLFVHIGPRKTGTSAIQQVLRSHDNKIVIYPKVGLWGDGSHHGLVFAFFQEERKWIKVQKAFADGGTSHILDRLAGEANERDRNVLISSETLATRDVEKFCSALLSCLKIEPLQVEILLACREHFGRAASLFNHRVRGSGERRNPDEFLHANLEQMCYEPLLAELAATDFKVTVLNYHPSETWVTRFLSHVGFSEDDVPQVPWKNMGFNPAALVAMLAVSQFAESGQSKKKYLKLAKRMKMKTRASDQFIFGRDAAVIADRRFEVDRKFLLEHHKIALVAPDFRRRQCGLSIKEDDYAEIARVAAKLGSEGERLLEFARRFCPCN